MVKNLDFRIPPPSRTDPLNMLRFIKDKISIHTSLEPKEFILIDGRVLNPNDYINLFNCLTLEKTNFCGVDILHKEQYERPKIIESDDETIYFRYRYPGILHVINKSGDDYNIILKELKNGNLVLNHLGFSRNKRRTTVSLDWKNDQIVSLHERIVTDEEYSRRSTIIDGNHVRVALFNFFENGIGRIAYLNDEKMRWETFTKLLKKTENGRDFLENIDYDTSNMFFLDTLKKK